VLERACQQATATEAFRAQVAKLDQTVAYLGAGDFSKRLREDYEFKGRLVRELGLKPQ